MRDSEAVGPRHAERLVRFAGVNRSFVLDYVPLGRSSLRVGTEHELRAGRSLYERSIEIGADTERLTVGG